MAKSAKRSPKKQTNTRPSQRKGTVIKSVPKEARDLLKKLTKENNGVKEMRKYGNGSIGVFFKNGKFRFVTGGNNLKPRKSGSKVKYPRISKLAAKRALLKYYNNKDYKSPANRKSALTRDICSDNKPTNRTSLYRRSPHLYDYPGVDDGSQCPKGHKVYHKKKITRSVKKNLLERLKGKTAQRKKTTKKSPKLSPRRKSKVTRKSQKGGDPLSDEDIAQIVEQYQAEHPMDGGSLAHMGIYDEMDADHGAEHMMDVDHGMEADYGMDAEHMEGGGYESDEEPGIFNVNMEGGFFGFFTKDNHKTPIPTDGDGISQQSTTPPPGLEQPEAQLNSDILEDQEEPVAHLPSGILPESGPESITEEGVVVGGEEPVAHLPSDLMDGGEMHAEHMMEAEHEMEADHGMEAEHMMEGGGGCGALDGNCAMDAEHEMEADHGMEAEHMMEGGMCPDCGTHDEDNVSHGSEQLGGSDLSLKQAVNLLRDYYQEKYGQ